jgi:hypothetical protein
MVHRAAALFATVACACLLMACETAPPIGPSTAPPVIVLLKLNGVPAVMEVGNTARVQLTAVIQQAGNQLAERPVDAAMVQSLGYALRWDVGPAAILSVNPDTVGTVILTAISPGDATVTAIADERRATEAVRVTARPDPTVGVSATVIGGYIVTLTPKSNTCGRSFHSSLTANLEISGISTTTGKGTGVLQDAQRLVYEIDAFFSGSLIPGIVIVAELRAGDYYHRVDLRQRHDETNRYDGGEFISGPDCRAEYSWFMIKQ